MQNIQQNGPNRSSKEDKMQLYRYWLGYFEDPTDHFCVFEDVADVFRIIDDEAFKKENHYKGWMMKCIHFFQMV